jgi:hypothetical protein
LGEYQAKRINNRIKGVPDEIGPIKPNRPGITHYVEDRKSSYFVVALKVRLIKELAINSE